MINRVLFFAISLFSCIVCYGQIEREEVVYFPPFDSLSVRKHMTSINQGAGYLILTKSSFKDEQAYNLVCTSWYELQGDSERTFNNVDSLLNFYTHEIGRNSIPIPDAFVEKYSEKSKCELLRMVFDEEGDYYGGRFYIGNNIVLAALLKKGLRIEVSDYDGNLYFDLNSIGCIER